ncbi:MAG: acyl-CoA thioesterase, partial [Bryobacterales bacterium]|nr:acyl-CoA thioesterase [Bryobacterales bacterium]
LVDIAAALAAMRHSRLTVVTASVDYMTFLYPVHIGEQVILKASVNRVFHTSMEVGVKVLVENLLTGDVRHTSSAYLTFVAIDEEGKKIALPQAVPQSDEEIRRFHKAGERRKIRLEMREQAKGRA